MLCSDCASGALLSEASRSLCYLSCLFCSASYYKRSLSFWLRASCCCTVSLNLLICASSGFCLSGAGFSCSLGSSFVDMRHCIESFNLCRGCHITWPVIAVPGPKMKCEFKLSSSGTVFEKGKARLHPRQKSFSYSALFLSLKATL